MDVAESTVRVHQTEQSRLGQVNMNNIPFGKVFSDHMLIAQYQGGQWGAPEILPYGPLMMTPSLAALHYGQAVFEGMKAYRTVDGRPVLFRPHDNYLRMNHSAARMSMPAIPERIFMDGIRTLVSLDADWIPPQDKGSLYLRPVYYAADEYIGVRSSDSYTFAVVTCPVGPYYQEPVSLLVNRDFIRAAQGGTGSAKCAGNYGGAMLPDKLAKAAGYHNVLWLDAQEGRYVEECGTMNIFFVIDDTVVTPPLNGTILAGITRASVIQILRDQGYPVEVRPVSIFEIQSAWQEGRLQDAFGTGTAATVIHISRIGFAGQDMELPPIHTRSVSRIALDTMNRIKTGAEDDPYGWVVPV
ncbi:MAG: branched-chain amino acid aminotransferase [Bacteroidia bacterium]|nr:branched-chain amino acid aminotransferase [Bacteroidia bacterium]